MTLRKYTIKVKDPTYWQEIHDTLCGISSCEHIPDREVSCFDEKEHSSTRGTFILHGSEAESLKNDPRIDWVELSPRDNLDKYPTPSPATKRWKRDVKVYRSLDNILSGVTTSNPTSDELNRTNWGVVRTGIKSSYELWGINSGEDIPTINSDVTYSLTGKNVDIVIHDSGVLQYHPEFLDYYGQSRVRDIILDGPFEIDPNYFLNNNLIYYKNDGRIGIATTSAKDWWEDGSKRSAEFSSIGTLLIPSNYIAYNSMGTALDGASGLIDGHGTACAGLAGGKNFGLAFEANIWNMPAIADNVSMDIETSFDAIKIFHKYKKTNPETGIKNPTVVNGSWGYQAAFGSSSTVNYKFRETTGSFTGNDPTTDQVTAMKNGLSNQVQGAYKSWSSSSRSNSITLAAKELIDEGVIYVSAAGNNNQRIGIGSDDPDRLNYMSDTYFGTTDPRAEFPTGTVPCNHRDWLIPQGAGFDSTMDFHPVICVGAMDDFIDDYSSPVYSSLAELKASYSNNGSGIDVWAPADETLTAGISIPSYMDYSRFDNPNFWDCRFNGTSAAAPVCTGLVALYLQTNPKATSIDVKNWLFTHGSKTVSSELYVDLYPDDTTTSYWTGAFNLRGAARRILYNPYTGDNQPKFEGTATMSGVFFSQV